ncbi:MAG TPA: pilus assembly protein TadG-related protein [Xanthobacteraceae bacterium]|nr:pilus assembly protein TadG-related protein [Xanthobacteraceae bacterium]
MKSAIKHSLRFGARVAGLRKLIGRFHRNRRGNVAIICALCAVPMVSAVGCVVDYSMASAIKTKLQAAADAATLATVSINSSVVTTAKNMSGNGAITNGSTTAVNYFNANLSTAPEDTGYTGLTSTASVTKNGQVVSAVVSFSANVPTYFMGILGYRTLTVSGTSTANYSLPTFINFYLMLDVSGSMSFPSTTAEQQRLIAVNPDNLGQYSGGCQFACHFTAQGACGQSDQGPIPAVGHRYSGYTPNPSPGGYCQGFIISRLGTTPSTFTSGTNSTNGSNVNWTNTPVSSCPTAGTTSCIQLRADAVGYAVNALLSQASATETTDAISNQFQVGLFPFIQNLCTSSAGGSNSCSVGLTSSISGSTITDFAAQLASLLDTGQNSTLGSGGTHFENALNSMNSFITSVGTGSSSSNALPYVFIVTDGSQDYQTQWNGNWNSQNWTSNSSVPYQNSATVIPPNSEQRTDYCQEMKNRGITVAVLYIPYGQIVDPNAGFASNEDGYANNNIANIPTALQNCASPNFFYTANSPADITNALVTMFEQAVSTAHITD